MRKRKRIQDGGATSNSRTFSREEKEDEMMNEQERMEEMMENKERYEYEEMVERDGQLPCGWTTVQDDGSLSPMVQTHKQTCWAPRMTIAYLNQLCQNNIFPMLRPTIEEEDRRGFLTSGMNRGEAMAVPRGGTHETVAIWR